MCVHKGINLTGHLLYFLCELLRSIANLDWRGDQGRQRKGGRSIALYSGSSSAFNRLNK